MSLNAGWSGAPDLRTRFVVISLAAIGIFLLLIMRLWYLQVINHERYLTLSEKNRIRYIPITPARGPLYDRNGQLLVDNRPAFGISVLRQEVDEVDPLLDRLSSLLGVEREELQKRWKAGKKFPRYRPVPLVEDVPWEEMEKVQENSVDLPGVITEVRPLRSYPYGELAAHLFGYLGEITDRDLQEVDEDRYRPGDYIGQSGLEKHLEGYLQGQPGERLVEVDVKGKELRILRTQDSVPGSRVFLTLDVGVQKAVEEAFADQAGAAVVLEVSSGEVLAMTSRPSFDPAAFARGISGKEWIELVQNPRHPLQNKALQGQYPPGSTFKIVTALAALRNGVATPQTVVDCFGSFSLGSRDFRCWKKIGHGRTDLKKALKESCDVYFYKVGMDVGIDAIAETARQLGLGEPLGFPLSGEKGGLVPDRAWKKRRFGERWYDGETVNAAIGQGYVLATPLQLAVMTAAVASGGDVLRPHVVKRIEDLAGRVQYESVPEVLHRTHWKEADLKAVRTGLEAAVNEPHGTAGASMLHQMRVAGKTGTAQVVKLKDEINKSAEHTIPYRFRDHALFVAYAPADNPQVAIAVVVEHGGHGGGVAGPIAKAAFEAYFHLEKEDDDPTLEVTGD